MVPGYEPFLELMEFSPSLDRPKFTLLLHVPSTQGTQLKGWVRTVLRNCDHRLLGKRPDKLTKFLFFFFFFFKSGWNLLSPGRRMGVFPPKWGCSRTSFPLFYTKSLNLHQTENTQPFLLLVPKDLATAQRGAGAVQTPHGSEPLFP